MSLFNLTGFTQIAGTAISLLPTGVQNRFGSGPKAVTIQATLEEVHHSTIEVTEHPVQVGAAITDHSYNKPAEVILRCAWSNSSLSGLIVGAQNLITNLTTNSLQANVNLMLSGSGTTQDYVTGIYSQLTNLKEARVPINIVTSLMLYKNMLITAIQVTRDVKSYQALMCSITCKEIILVDVLSGNVATQNQSTPQTTADPVALGSQNLLGGTIHPPTLPTLSWMSFP
jgi:hypothetical protein